jgi:hypothetical protein
MTPSGILVYSCTHGVSFFMVVNKPNRTKNYYVFKPGPKTFK